MGEVKWAAYSPKDINWEARSRVEAWSRHDRDIEINTMHPRRTHTGSGFLFALGMVALLTITLWKYM